MPPLRPLGLLGTGSGGAPLIAFFIISSYLTGASLGVAGIEDCGVSGEVTCSSMLSLGVLVSKLLSARFNVEFCLEDTTPGVYARFSFGMLGWRARYSVLLTLRFQAATFTPDEDFGVSM